MCNLGKGTNLAGIDPDSGRVVRLFHPRIDEWTEHFQFDGPRIIGRTPFGRATVLVCNMNEVARVRSRRELLDAGETL